MTTQFTGMFKASGNDNSHIMVNRHLLSRMNTTIAAHNCMYMYAVCEHHEYFVSVVYDVHDTDKVFVRMCTMIIPYVHCTYGMIIVHSL